MLTFRSWLTEAKKNKKKETREPLHQQTATSSPLRGQNQDQSGYGTSHSTADYTISDGFIPGLGSVRAPQVQMQKTGKTDGSNAPHSASSMQSAADKRRQQLDKLAVKQTQQQQQERERQIKSREKEQKLRERLNKLRSSKPSGDTNATNN